MATKTGSSATSGTIPRSWPLMATPIQGHEPHKAPVECEDGEAVVPTVAGKPDQHGR